MAVPKARRGPSGELRLTAEDRATLERWTTRRKTAHGLTTRAEIVLRCSGGCSNSQVARPAPHNYDRWHVAIRFVAGGCWTSHAVATSAPYR